MMKKSLILFLFIGMFLCFGRGFIGKEVFAQAYSPAIIVQCPYCNTTNTVYNTGTYSCSNCRRYFEIVPAAVAAPPPVVITPPPPVIVAPPPVYYYPDYPYYPGWYPGLNLSFGFGFGRGHFERGHECFEHRHGGGHGHRR